MQVDVRGVGGLYFFAAEDFLFDFAVEVGAVFEVLRKAGFFELGGGVVFGYFSGDGSWV